MPRLLPSLQDAMGRNSQGSPKKDGEHCLAIVGRKPKTQSRMNEIIKKVEEVESQKSKALLAAGRKFDETRQSSRRFTLSVVTRQDGDLHRIDSQIVKVKAKYAKIIREELDPDNIALEVEKKVKKMRDLSSF